MPKQSMFFWLLQHHHILESFLLGRYDLFIPLIINCEILKIYQAKEVNKNWSSHLENSKAGIAHKGLHVLSEEKETF